MYLFKLKEIVIDIIKVKEESRLRALIEDEKEKSQELLETTKEVNNGTVEQQQQQPSASATTTTNKDVSKFRPLSL